MLILTRPLYMYELFEQLETFDERIEINIQCFYDRILSNINEWINKQTDRQLIIHFGKHPYQPGTIIKCNYWRDQLWLYFIDNYEFDIEYDNQYQILPFLNSIRLSTFFNKHPYYKVDNLKYIRKSLINILIRHFFKIDIDTFIRGNLDIFTRQLLNAPIRKYINDNDMHSMRIYALMSDIYIARRYDKFIKEVELLTALKARKELNSAAVFLCDKMLRWHNKSFDMVTVYELLKKLNILNNEDISKLDPRFARLALRLMANSQEN